MSLAEFLDRDDIDGIEIIEGPEDEPGRFRLTTLAAADWAFRKLAQQQATRAELLAEAQRERERIDEWVEHVVTPVDNSIDYFEGLLKEWAASEVLTEFAEVQDWSKVRHKTLSTPHGKVRARRSTDGQFSASGELMDLVLTVLSEAGREELLVVTPKLGATLLDEAREAGTVRLAGDGTYEVADAATGEWRALPGVKRTGRGQITFKVETAS